MPKERNLSPRFRFVPLAELGPQSVRLTPAPVESYLNRAGYDPRFVDPGTPIPLPKLGEARRRDVAVVVGSRSKTYELKYTHFSTAVSKSRRMPIFSAVNIDGSKPRKVSRGDVWKVDPRIPLEFQILQEVYGNERDGFFSRGHMTRRMDPDWGPTSVAELADADTFHATNAAPQVQRFNAGLWGDIEDYVLANTKRDSMRVSVFTGPLFARNDPVVHKVKVPVRFWKVVAFIHDETGALTATGYLASQAKAIADLKPAFVFGDFENQQRPIKAIEALAGLSFGPLSDLDVLAGAGPSFASSLHSVRDIMLS